MPNIIFLGISNGDYFKMKVKLKINNEYSKNYSRRYHGVVSIGHKNNFAILTVVRFECFMLCFQKQFLINVGNRLDNDQVIWLFPP